jgi:hypothetical protein
MKVSLSELLVHPANERIYEPTDLNDLIESITDNDLLEPIVITKERKIISGHRRYAALLQLGTNKCEVRVIKPKNEIITLIEHNRHRQKTASDILNEARYLEGELKSYVGRGRGASKNRQGKKKGQRITTVLEVANRLGVKESQLKQLKSISNYEPSLIEKIDAGELSINGAYEIVRRKHISKKRKSNGVGVDQFEKDFKRLLVKYEPEMDRVDTVLKQTYPYSLSTTGVSEDHRAELINHLEFLKKLNSRELVLVYKQDELLHSEFSKKELRRAKSFLPSLQELEKFFLSNPSKEDIELIVVGDSEIDRTLWNIFRLTIHNMENDTGPGRRMSAVVGFRVRKKFKLLGLISFQSPSLALSVRDEHIGWTDEQRTKYRENIVNLHVCVSTQPFGHNFLGGKMLAMMSLDLVRHWERKYRTKIVGIETTSLHGSQSQYQSIKWWKHLGTTEGKILLKPLRDERSYWRLWLKDNHRSVYEDCQTRSGPLQQMLSHIYRYLGISVKEYQHGHKRGFFFCPINPTYREVLTETPTNGELEGITDNWFEDWWIKKSIKRYGKLLAEKKLQKETLFHEPTQEHSKHIERWLRSRGVK